MKKLKGTIKKVKLISSTNGERVYIVHTTKKRKKKKIGF